MEEREDRKWSNWRCVSHPHFRVATRHERGEKKDKRVAFEVGSELKEERK
jgi:hypothetical protein